MHDDRKLLELAAKAAGRDVIWKRGMHRGDPHEGLFDRSTGHVTSWNPLTDDGDALRLAVKFGFIVDIDTEEHYTEIDFTSNYEDKSVSEGHGFDAMEATRRAIVRAAAAIGEAMQ